MTPHTHWHVIAPIERTGRRDHRDLDGLGHGVPPRGRIPRFARWHETCVGNAASVLCGARGPTFFLKIETADHREADLQVDGLDPDLDGGAPDDDAG